MDCMMNIVMNSLFHFVNFILSLSFLEKDLRSRKRSKVKFYEFSYAAEYRKSMAEEILFLAKINFFLVLNTEITEF